MKTKAEIVLDWLPRYTGEKLENFGEYLLLTNFSNYLQLFADWNGVKISDVTKITIYICNPHDVPKARGILQTYFAGAAPASTLCILRGLANPNFLLEIEAIAAV